MVQFSRTGKRTQSRGAHLKGIPASSQMSVHVSPSTVATNMLFPLFYAGPVPADLQSWSEFMWNPSVRKEKTVSQTVEHTSRINVQESIVQIATQKVGLNAPETVRRNAPETIVQNAPQKVGLNAPETVRRNAPETVVQSASNRKDAPRNVPSKEAVLQMLHTPIETPPVRNMKTVSRIPFSKSRRTTLLSLMTDRPLPTLNDEMAEQLRIAAHYESHPGLRKLWKAGRHRLYNTDMEEIMTDLMSADVSNKRFQEGRLSCFGRIHTNLAVLIAYADFYKRSAIVLDEAKRTYVVFGSMDEDTTSYDVWIRFDPVANTFSAAEPRALQGYMEMEDMRRPLKAATHYTKEELCVLVNRMLPVSSTPKTYSKKEMYEALQHYCWGIGTVEAAPTQTVCLMDSVSL